MFNFSNSQSEHSEKANSSEQSTDEYSPSERPKRVTKMSSKLSESDESSDESSQVTKTATYEKRWFYYSLKKICCMLINNAFINIVCINFILENGKVTVQIMILKLIKRKYLVVNH